MSEFLDSPAILAVGWMLLHFVWQAAVVGLAHAAILKRLEDSAPELRHAVSLAALLLLLLAPLVTAGLYFANGAAAAAGPGGDASAPVASFTATVAPTAELSPASMAELLLPWLVASWLLGVLVYATRLMLAYAGMRRIIRQASVAAIPAWLADELDDLRRLLGIRRRIHLAVSRAIDSPMVTGWLAPVILLPACATTRLAPDQLRMALLHELAHVSRNDYLINLMQVVAETLFFFHPAVHRISASLREEREKCCDDIVTRYCGNRIAYARLLADLESLRQQPVLALGMTTQGGSGELALRVQRIVGVGVLRRERRRRSNWPMLLPLLLALLLLLVREALPDKAVSTVSVSLELPPAMENALPEPIRASADLPMATGENAMTSEGPAASASLPGKRNRDAAATGTLAVAERASRESASRDPAAREASSKTSGADESPADSVTRPERNAAANTAVNITAPASAMKSATVAGPASPSSATAEEPAATTRQEQAVDAQVVDWKGGALLHSVAPEFPRDALRRGREGFVTLEFTIGVDGKPRDIHIVDAQPHRVFENSARRALLQWRFAPFTRNGKPTAKTVTQTMEFRVNTMNRRNADDCETLTGTRICRPASPDDIAIRVID